MKAKTRRERFEDVAGKRVQMVLDKLDSLSGCANKRNYEFTASDIEKMFKAINEKSRQVRLRFESSMDTGRERNVFKF